MSNVSEEDFLKSNLISSLDVYVLVCCTLTDIVVVLIKSMNISNISINHDQLLSVERYNKIKEQKWKDFYHFSSLLVTFLKNQLSAVIFDKELIDEAKEEGTDVIYYDLVIRKL